MKIPENFYERVKEWDVTPEPQRLMLVHVPKTGGTHTQHVLEHLGLLRTDKLMPNSFHDGCPMFLRGRHPINFGYHIHSNIHPIRIEWKTAPPKRPGIYEFALRFSMVRNPFDYLVSYYHNNSNNDTPDFDAMGSPEYGGTIPYGYGGCNYIHGCKTFRDFVMRYTDPNFPFFDTQFQRFLFYHYFKGEESVFLNPPNNVRGSADVHFIIKYEHLKEGLFHLFKAAGVVEDSQELELPTKNDARDRVSTLRKKRHYKEFYDDEMRERVERHCSRELAMFGYDFDGPTDDTVIIDTGIDIDLERKNEIYFYDVVDDIAKMHGNVL